jgi:hypothetical protein
MHTCPEPYTVPVSFREVRGVQVSEGGRAHLSPIRNFDTERPAQGAAPTQNPRMTVP